MPAARIASLEFVPGEPAVDSATAGLKAGLEDGKQSTFSIATPDQPALWTAAEGFSFGAPVLFARRLDQETVAEAAQAMAAEMGGYWLRYYNSPGERAHGGPAKKPRRARKR
jgi:hypothetical protein